ncbi:MAG: hypothetical protein LC107_06420 [Chitinophagales bacterium]|nr:hypothetical protein [Chitinophagales bacterium]
MKLLVKILLFVFVALVTNVEVVSASITFPYIQEITTSFSFQNEVPKTIYKFIRNDLANCCQNEQNLVDYRERAKGVEADAAKGVTNGLSKTISAQKQARHIAGTAKSGGGFLNSVDDAQSVLNAVHSGKATFLGTSKAGHQVYRFNGVTGTNVNLGAGITGQPTNVFMIKGTTSPTVVPTNPFWKAP